MIGSRLVLLAAWALLAVGAVTQFVTTGERSEVTGVVETLAPADATRFTDRLVMADEEAGPGTQTSADADPDQVLFDDPADWHQAGVALPATVTVATVIDDDRSEAILGTSFGVAATNEPGPGPVAHWFPSPTQFGGPRVFLVVDADSNPDYVKVSLPVMPNGQEGWIPRSRVELTEVAHRALVDLTRRTVTVWAGDEIITQTDAVIGAEVTPTPRGLFYVRDIVAQDNVEGGFGPYVLALSGFSETLETFEGKLPALAIHGTDQPNQVGSRLSAGCIRIPNELITMLAEQVPLGTPVTIVA